MLPQQSIPRSKSVRNKRFYLETPAIAFHICIQILHIADERKIKFQALILDNIRSLKRLNMY